MFNTGIVQQNLVLDLDGDGNVLRCSIKVSTVVDSETGAMTIITKAFPSSQIVDLLTAVNALLPQVK